MPWDNSPEARQRQARTYNSEYRRNSRTAKQRAGYRCENCGSARNIETNHIIRPEHGGTHDLSNLQVLCADCHGKITAQQGGGFRSARIADPDPAPRTAW